VLQDRGYDSNKNRQNIIALNNVAVIPSKKNRTIEIPYDKKLYKLRGAVERFFGKLKENRRLALRYEKDDVTFLSFVAFGTMRRYLC
jgi:transposase